MNPQGSVATYCRWCGNLCVYRDFTGRPERSAACLPAGIAFTQWYKNGSHITL